MSNTDLPNIAHFIDYLSPNTAPWFQVLISKISANNYIFANEFSNFNNIKINNARISRAAEVFITKNAIINKAVSVLTNTYRYKKIKKELVNNQIQLIHAHFAHMGWETLKLKKELKIPLVVSFYGYDYQSVPHKYPVWIKRYAKLFQEVDLIICEGENGKKILEKMECSPSIIKVLRLGIETEKVPFLNRTKKTDELNLVQIANLVEKKGHKFTIKAFAESLKECPNMHLTIVGNGAEKIKSEISSFLIEHNLGEKITLIDRIDYNKIHSFLANYTAFIHPSCYSHDMDCEGGAPIVLLDAQATGLPIISTLHCDIPDEVIHEKTGLLATEKNVNELATFIKRFYKMNQDEYNIYAKNAQEHVSLKYNIADNAMLFIEAYKHLLKP